jgi:hypothetical protein
MFASGIRRKDCELAVDPVIPGVVDGRCWCRCSLSVDKENIGNARINDLRGQRPPDSRVGVSQRCILVSHLLTEIWSIPVIIIVVADLWKG